MALWESVDPFTAPVSVTTFANWPVTWQLLPVHVSSEFKKNMAKYRIVTLQ